MVEPLRIGTLEATTNLVLAPMAGYSDVAFRLVARACGGVGLATTALLSPVGIQRRSRKSMELAATCADDSPLAMQFYGSDADELCEAARWAEDQGADAVDINMGCTVPKVVKRNAGGALLRNPDAAARMIERVARVLRRVPLTAKLRLGWDDESIVAPKLARMLEDVGVAAITVHGRTVKMQFGGAVRLDGIAAVVAAVKRIPVIGNGDVRSPQDAKLMIEKTGCRGVMIGRWALAAPWIFRDTWSYLTTGAIPLPPTLEEKCQLMRDHFYNIVRFRNEWMAVLEFRKAASWYAKTMHPSKPLRQSMRLIQSAADFERALADFIESQNVTGL